MLEDKGSPKLFIRLGLQGLEWIFSLSVFSLIASRFSDDSSVASFLIAWGVIGWLLYCATLVLTLLYLFKSFDFFTAHLEFSVQTAMAVIIWFVGAVTASAKIAAVGVGSSVIALWWVTFILSVSSSVVCFLDARDGSSEGGKAAEPGAAEEEL